MVDPLKEVADLPQNVLDQILAGKSKSKAKGTSDANGPSNKIPKGGRHIATVSKAGGLRARGLSPDEIYPLLLVFNQNELEIPLPDEEVRRIADGMARYSSNSPEEIIASLDLQAIEGNKSEAERATALAALVDRIRSCREGN